MAPIHLTGLSPYGCPALRYCNNCKLINLVYNDLYFFTNLTKKHMNHHQEAYVSLHNIIYDACIIITVFTMSEIQRIIPLLHSNLFKPPNGTVRSQIMMKSGTVVPLCSKKVL